MLYYIHHTHIYSILYVKYVYEFNYVYTSYAHLASSSRCFSALLWRPKLLQSPLQAPLEALREVRVDDAEALKLQAVRGLLENGETPFVRLACGQFASIGIEAPQEKKRFCDFQT